MFDGNIKVENADMSSKILLETISP